MKKIVTVLIILSFTLNAFSQDYFYKNSVIGYDASTLLFSTDNIKGTARFTSMSGAFGALGGDLSAVEVNPAGLAVFNNSEATITFDNNSIDTSSNFFNTNTNSTEDNFNISQVGALLVFENNLDTWSKFALGVNFTVLNDFSNSYITNGVSSITNFNEDPFLNFDTDDTNDIFFENVDSQKFINNTSGSNDKITFSIAGEYNAKTYFGFSINSYSLDFGQQVFSSESSNDGNSNTLETTLNQRLLVYGDGISFGFGVISKPISNLRVGLAYQTPTWYNLTEEFSDDLIINPSTNGDSSNYFEGRDSFFEYQIRTPSRLTGSIAYIFNKMGLISLDYTLRDYSNSKLKPSSDFLNENNNLKSLKNTSELRIGGEYRYKTISFRAGFHTQENPIKSINANTDGYSFGLGFKFSNTTKLDFSYDQTTSHGVYNFYNFEVPEVATNLDISSNIKTKNKRITATLTIGL